MFEANTPERYAELLAGMGLTTAEIQRATYAHCSTCGLQGYRHLTSDCGAFTPAIDVEAETLRLEADAAGEVKS